VKEEWARKIDGPKVLDRHNTKRLCLVFWLTERLHIGLAPEIPEDLYMLIKKVCHIGQNAMR